MKKTQIFSSLLVILLATLPIFGQKYDAKYLRKEDKELKALTREMTPEGWIYFKKEAEVKRETFFEKLGKNLGMDKDYEMRKIKDILDKNGIRHENYQLYYKGAAI